MTPPAFCSTNGQTSDKKKDRTQQLRRRADSLIGTTFPAESAELYRQHAVWRDEK